VHVTHHDAGLSRSSQLRLVAVPISGVRFVKGLEFRPGNSVVVHHANIRIDRTARSRQLDLEDPAPGYEGLLAFSAVYPDGHFLGWTPGQIAPLLPKGLAWRLTPGTDLVVEMHLVPTGKPEEVKPSIGLFFGDEPPEHTPAMLRLGRQSIDIPAGQKEYVITDSFVLPVDVEVHALQPHAHYRAREVKGTATLPDGTTKPLIYIKDWDFKWQHVYRYVSPQLLPKGMTLAMRYTYDNSADNPRNPYQPPRRVLWGQRSSDEMGDLWIQMLTRTERDLAILSDAIRPKITAEDIVGHELRLRANPSDVTLHNDVALMYDEMGQPEKAALHFEAVAKLQPNSSAAHDNFGTSLAAAGKLSEAVDQYRQALRLEPDYARAHHNLGQALQKLGLLDESLAHLREAVRLDPNNAEVHHSMGSLARARGQISEALDRFRHAVELSPEWVQGLGSLAWLLATAPSPELRNAGEAIRVAERATELTARGDAGILDVLAAAQAASGRFDLAVATCDAALELNPDAAVAGAIRQRQAPYKQKRPYIARVGTH